jgi:hypothetical protein
MSFDEAWNYSNKVYQRKWREATNKESNEKIKEYGK